MNKIEVSVIIVCMNNYEQLRGCLDSIKKYTLNVTYEVLIVAYFFSDENLTKLGKEYPWVNAIISNEIRGFSANNNLALRQARGQYCFVVNDDTYMEMPVIDGLVDSIRKDEKIAIVSPKIISPNRYVQYCGIPPISWIDWIKILYKMQSDIYDKTNSYVNRQGFFKTYNIVGAAFLIRTNIFREMGFFDERYFFGPEDKALSTSINKMGYECWVNADIEIYHLRGQTGGAQSKTICATRPANRKGCLIMFAEGNKVKKIVLAIAIWLNSFTLAVYWFFKSITGSKSAWYSFVANINVCLSIFLSKTPTEIFKKYYKVG